MAVKGANKTVYVTFVYHGNMCWDRYTKDQIRAWFTRMYRSITEVWKQNPELGSNVELSGVTLNDTLSSCIFIRYSYAYSLGLDAHGVIIGFLKDCGERKVHGFYLAGAAEGVGGVP